MYKNVPYTSVEKVISIILIIIAVSLVTAIYFFGKPISVEEADTPMDASTDPIQINESIMRVVTHNTRSMSLIYIPQADYEITAKVVDKKRYHAGWTSKIAPYDLALAWGKLTQPEMKEFINYYQMKRFYFFKYSWDCPVSEKYISEHSSNNHLISANENICKAIGLIKKGDIIQLWGSLVNVEGIYKNFEVTWDTSTTRMDSGNGACEIIYVEKIRIKNKIYR